MPKGRTPSLIGSGLGRPDAVTAGRESPCSRCDGPISRGEKCYDVQQPLKPFSATRRFCASCFASVITQSRRDLDKASRL